MKLTPEGVTLLGKKPNLFDTKGVGWSNRGMEVFCLDKFAGKGLVVFRRDGYAGIGKRLFGK